MSIESAVVISLQVAGVADIHRALRSVEQTIVEMEKAATKTRAGGARERVRITKQEVEGEKSAWGETAKAAVAFEKQRQQIRDNSAKMAGQIAVRQARDEIREAERAAKATEKLEHDKTRAIEREAKRRQGIIDTSARWAGQLAARQAREEAAALKSTQAARERFAGGIAGRVTGSIGHTLSRAGAVLGGTMAVGASFAAADAVRESLSAEKAAQLLANTAHLPGGRTYDKGSLLRKAGEIGIESNYSKVDVIKALQGYTDISGDLESGLGGMSFMAKLAKGQGAELSDVAAAAGTLRVQNPHLDSKGIENMLAGIVGGARIGAISAKEMAQYAGSITSTSAMYAGDQATNQRNLLGMAQLIRPVLGSSDESATVITRLGQDIASNRDKVEGSIGKGVYKKGTTQLRDLAELVPELMKATGGDAGKLKHVGIGRESIRAFDALRAKYNDAGGGTVGAKAVQDEIKRFENASVGAEEVMTNFADVMTTSSEKFEHAILLVREALETKLTPWIERFAEKLPDLVPKLERIIESSAQLAEWFADNPFKGIGAIVLAAVVKDLAAAGIGSAAKAAMVSALGGGGGGAAGAATSALGGLGSAVGAGVAGGVASGYVAINSELGYEAGQDAGKTIAAKVRAYATGNRTSGMSPEAAQKILDESEGRLRGGSVLGHALDIIKSPVSDEASKRYSQYKMDQGVVDTEAIKKAIAEAVAAGARDGVKGGGGSASGAGDASRSVSQTHPARGGAGG